jgi:hypothetical protein
MRQRRAIARACGKPAQQFIGLPDEHRQNLAPERAIAKRHARKMLGVDRRLAGNERRGRNPVEGRRRRHDNTRWSGPARPGS